MRRYSIIPQSALPRDLCQGPSNRFLRPLNSGRSRINGVFRQPSLATTIRYAVIPHSNAKDGRSISSDQTRAADQWQMGLIRNSLKNMVPPRRLERPTRGLGRRRRMKRQLLAFQLIGLLALSSGSCRLSNHFPFVSRELNRPDL